MSCTTCHAKLPMHKTAFIPPCCSASMRRIKKQIKMEDGTHRYCRICQDRVPLDRFANGRKRYICKQHYRELAQLKPKPTLTPEEKSSRAAWIQAYKDAIYLSGSATINLSNKVIATLLTKPSEYLLPRFPLLPVDISNVFVTSRPIRRFLLCTFKETKSIEEYMKALKTFDEMQKNAIM